MGTPIPIAQADVMPVASPGSGNTLLRNMGIVTVGNIVSAALAFILLLVMTRLLSPAEFAIVACILALIDGGQLLLDAMFNAGLITVAVRDGEHAKPSPAALKAGLWLKIAGGSVLAAVLAIGAMPLSAALGGGGSLAGAIVVAGCAAAVLGIHSFACNVLQIRQEFAKLAVLTIAKNLFRLVMVAWALAAGWSDGISLSMVIAASAVILCAASVCAISWDFLRDPTPLKPEFAKLGAINRWMVLVALAVFASRLDIWLVGWLSDMRQAGLYAVAAQLCLGVGILSQAIVTALLPSIVRPREPSEINRFLRLWLMMLPVIVLTGLAAWLVSEPLITLLFGVNYSGAGRVFALVFAASLMTLSGGPLMLLLLSLDEARILGLASFAQVLIRIAFALVLVPASGAFGGAISDVAARLIAMAACSYFIWAAVRKQVAR